MPRLVASASVFDAVNTTAVAIVLKVERGNGASVRTGALTRCAVAEVILDNETKHTTHHFPMNGIATIMRPTYTTLSLVYER